MTTPSTETTELKAKATTLYDLAIRVAFPILLACGGWLFNQQMEMRDRVKEIEATRYTQQDATTASLALRTEITSVAALLSDMGKGLARQEALQESSEKRLQRIEERLDQVVNATSNLESKLGR